MIRSIETYFPDEVKFTKPDGGMFLWISLPGNLSSMELFEQAIKKNVAIVPGNPFYIGKEDTSTCRLNFSCVDEATIEEGIMRLSNAIKTMLKK